MTRATRLRNAIYLAIALSLSSATSRAQASAAEPERAEVGETAPQPPPIAELLSPEARRDYEAGHLLYESGDYASALLKFQSAYEASRAGPNSERDPRLLWSAAACERALHRYANAMVLVRRYLDSGSPLITAEAAENALAFLTAASAMTVSFSVEANVPGAVTYVDDRFVGPVPLPSDTRIDLGTHRVLVRKTGYSGHGETVTSSGQAVHVKAVLRPVVHRGKLVIHAGPNDAIHIDGTLRAFGRFEAELPSGPHSVRVSAKGRKTFARDVLLADDQTRSMDVTLEPADSTGIPGWAYVVAGVALSAGAVTGAYFWLTPSDSGSSDLPSGSIGQVELPLRQQRSSGK
jgi:hypothetical protein